VSEVISKYRVLNKHTHTHTHTHTYLDRLVGKRLIPFVATEVDEGKNTFTAPRRTTEATLATRPSVSWTLAEYLHQLIPFRVILTALRVQQWSPATLPDAGQAI
jgi:hypothetical protein